MTMTKSLVPLHRVLSYLWIHVTANWVQAPPSYATPPEAREPLLPSPSERPLSSAETNDACPWLLPNSDWALKLEFSHWNWKCHFKDLIIKYWEAQGSPPGLPNEELLSLLSWGWRLPVCTISVIHKGFQNRSPWISSQACILNIGKRKIQETSNHSAWCQFSETFWNR